MENPFEHLSGQRLDYYRQILKASRAECVLSILHDHESLVLYEKFYYLGKLGLTGCAVFGADWEGFCKQNITESALDEASVLLCLDAIAVNNDVLLLHQFLLALAPLHYSLNFQINDAVFQLVIRSSECMFLLLMNRIPVMTAVLENMKATRAMLQGAFCHIVKRDYGVRADKSHILEHSDLSFRDYIKSLGGVMPKGDQHAHHDVLRLNAYKKIAAQSHLACVNAICFDEAVDVDEYPSLSIPEKFYYLGKLRLSASLIENCLNRFLEQLEWLDDETAVNTERFLQCLTMICRTGDTLMLHQLLRQYQDISPVLKRFTAAELENTLMGVLLASYKQAHLPQDGVDPAINPIIAAADHQAFIEIDQHYNPAACVVQIFKRFPGAFCKDNCTINACTDPVFKMALYAEIKKDPEVIFNIVTRQCLSLEMAFKQATGAWFESTSQIEKVYGHLIHVLSQYVPLDEKDVLKIVCNILKSEHQISFEQFSLATQRISSGDHEAGHTKP